MRKLITAALLALLWAGRADAQPCDGCGIGYMLNGLPLTGGTLTGPLLVVPGTVAAPGLAFAGDPDNGMISLSNDSITWVSNNAGRLNLSSGYLRVASAGGFAISSTADPSAAANTVLTRNADNNWQVGSDAATAAAQTFSAADSTGATIAGASLTLKGGNGTSGIANGGALILAGGANSSTGEPGAVRISDGGTKPTCAAGIRGSIWYDAGGAGVLDTFEVCRKDAANAYAWVTLF